MAFNNEISFLAAGTIAPCRFVTPATTDPQTVTQSGSGEKPCGISQEGQKGAPGITGSDAAVAAASGDQLHVYGLGNDCLLEYGGTVDEGDYLKPDASGKGVAASTGNFYGARAIQAGTSGTKGKVQVIFGTL